jgi:hypothetical protein
MLENLLREIKKGGALQAEGLAARLKVSPGLVRAMLEDLERRGILTQMPTACGDGCGGCSLSSSCGPGSGGKLWMLVDRHLSNS